MSFEADRAAGDGPAPTKHASPAPGGARARTGRRRGQSGPNPLPSCRLTPAPTAATDRTLTVIVLGELATGGAATGWVGPRTGSASSEAGSAAASVSRLPTLDRYRLGQDQRRPEPASRSRHELEQVVWVSAWTFPRGPDTVAMRPGLTAAGGHDGAAVPTQAAVGSCWWSAADGRCTRRSSGRSRLVPRRGCGSGSGRPAPP
jgi:hypothetical protein